MKVISCSPTTHGKRGQSMTELIIAVATLAIIGSIGLVNFQESMARRNTTDAMLDLASIRSALLAYQSDHSGTYPFHGPISTDIDGYGNIRSFAFLTLTENITTPVAYLADYPTDPFKAGANATTGPNAGQPFESGNIRDEGYVWLPMQQMGPNPGDPGLGFGFFSTAQAWQATFDVIGNYKAFSLGHSQGFPGGPNLPGVTPFSSFANYDPTNGAMSAGVIHITELNGMISSVEDALEYDY